MDKWLVPLTILALFTEVIFLLSDMNISFLNWTSQPGLSQESRPVMGRIESIQSKVKRRSNHSIIWKKSQTHQALFANDSLLTLSQSSAKVSLQNKTLIELQENTLLVLDPIQNQGDQSLHLRFFRGEMSSKTAQDLSISNQNLHLRVSAGSQFSIRALKGERIEVELQAGKLSFASDQKQHLPDKSPLSKSESSASVQKIFTFENSQLVDTKEISPHLQWSKPNKVRIYSHEWPKVQQVSWTGAVSRVRHLFPDRSEKYYSPNSSTSFWLLNLVPGTHSLFLLSEKKSSSSLQLQVLQAPKIVYFHPLPRNRIRSQDKSHFSWSPLPAAKSYVIEVSRDASFTNILFRRSTIKANFQGKLTTSSRSVFDPNSSANPKSKNTSKSSTATKSDSPTLIGKLFWRIIAVDDKGFHIPAYYTYPLFSVRSPLPAPKHLDKTAMLKASENASIAPLKPYLHQLESLRSSLWNHLKTWWRTSLELARSLATNVAWAADGSDRPHQDFLQKKYLLFSWKQQSMASHYVIEISSQPSFINPEVIAKVSENKFRWSAYKKIKYYWRVASEGPLGEMGFFSVPKEINLPDKWNQRSLSLGVQWGYPIENSSILKLNASAITNYLIQKNISRAPSSLKKSQVVVASTVKDIKANADPKTSTNHLKTGKKSNLQLSEITKSLPQNAVLPSVAWHPLDKKNQLQISHRGAYRWESLKNTDNVASKLQGFSPLRLDFQGNWVTKKKGSWLIQLNWEELNWKTQPDLPFQEPLKDWTLNLNLLKRLLGSPWAFGLRLERFLVAERTALESIQFKSLWATGLALSYFLPLRSSWEIEHNMGLTVVGDLYQFSVAEQIQYCFKSAQWACLGSFIEGTYLLTTSDVKRESLSGGLLATWNWH